MKAVENLREIPLVDTDPRIPDRDAYLSLAAGDKDSHRPPAVGELQRVADEISHHLADLLAVGPRLDRGVGVDCEIDAALFGDGLQAPHDVPREGANVDRREHEIDRGLRLARGVEQLADRVDEAPGVVTDDFDVLPLGFFEPAGDA